MRATVCMLFVLLLGCEGVAFEDLTTADQGLIFHSRD